MSMSIVLELLPFGLYLILLIWFGLRAHRKGADEEEYLLSNRSLSVPALVATIVTTWYGGILGVGEFVYRYGISAWVVFGLPYYVFAALFALTLAAKIRRENVFSIPDILYQKYGRKAGLLGSGFILIMTTPAPYILMVGVLIQLFLPIGFFHAILLGTIISVIYVYWGGFRSVVQTDKLQFVFMFAGFIALLFYLLNSPISLNELFKHLEDGHLDPTGGMSIQNLVVWFLIASWTFIDPGFHQRCAAARSDRIARKGILYSILFWFIFDMLSLTTGLYAVAYLSDIKPLLAYPILADYILPSFLKGIFIVGLLAIVMSTVDSYAFLSALTFGRDIIGRFNKVKNSSNRYTRLGLILTALISILLIMSMPSVIELWYNIGSLFIPPLLIPVILAYFPRFRIPGRLVFLIMLISFILTLSLFLNGQLTQEGGIVKYPLGIEPFFPGFAASFLLHVAAYLVLRRNQSGT